MPRTARLLAFSLLSVLALIAALQDRFRRSSAADSEAITWGATEPTWSPDSARLAFSLFGSIWQAPAGGGEAVQLSSSAGYHDHPAWSPDGSGIAFISGTNPRGRFAKISGKLRIVDVRSGEEREIALPRPTAGTPAWSPDSKKITVPLSVPNSGALLVEVDPRTGEVVRLQSRPQRSPAGRWTEVSASREGERLFFAATRIGAPQIWSMPAGRQGFLVQTPLTRYLREHIVNLDGVSALPDGSGAVYSADLINGRGNFELYRVGFDGAEPAALTETARHELSPEVSPDGARIAFAANYTGNLDVYTMPVGGGEAKHVRLTKLRYRKSSGRVRVKIVDEKGAPTAARLYVEASDGKSYAPAGEPIFYYPLMPGATRDGFFVASGDDAFPAPAGKLKLVAVKGFEYRVSETSLDVPAAGEAEITLTLERWTNWNQRGWYSGENHFHANYLGSYYQRPRQSLAWLKAMDLNAANMIAANAAGAFIHDKEFFTGKLSPLSTDRYFLRWGQEYRNSDPLGHMGFLNIGKLVPPSYTSVVGSDSPYDFPLNTMAALAAQGQGGLVTYMHPIGGTMNDVFDTNLGAKEAVVTAAHGALDTLDILPYGEAAYQLWYGLLNCGFHIAAGAGTDTFTNWRGINRIPGGSRQYVHVGGKMTWERWIERYRQGRSFSTNGPLLGFEVNGQGMGETIRADSGVPYRARLVGEVSSRTPLERIEFVQNGEVIESRAIPSSARSFRLEKEVEVRRSSWFAVRVFGPAAKGLTGAAKAHSSPVYVEFDGRPTLVGEDLETALGWIDRFWGYLVERDNFGPGDNRERAAKMVDKARRIYRDKLARAR